MSSRLLNEDDVDHALHWLRDNAKAFGKAKERARHAEHWLKHVEALEFKMSEAKTQDAKKADARTSNSYVEAMTEEAEAAGAFEEMKALRETYELKIEAWRTASSNYRSMKI